MPIFGSDDEGRPPMDPYHRMWTIEMAVEELRRVEAITSPYGWYFCLGGSVLHKGKSDHDLDVVVVPKYKANITDLYRALVYAGWKRKRDSEQMRAKWKDPDPKFVEEWETQSGKRVDVIILRTVYS